MPGTISQAVIEWLARSSVPNGLFLLALLTAPATWAARAMSFLRSRYLGGEP